MTCPHEQPRVICPEQRRAERAERWAGRWKLAAKRYRAEWAHVVDDGDPDCEDEPEAPSEFRPWGPRPHKTVEIGQLYRRVECTSGYYGETVRIEAVDEHALTASVVVPAYRHGSDDIGKVRGLKRQYFLTSEWWLMAEDELDERDTKPFCVLNGSHCSTTTTHRVRTPSGIALVLHDGEGNLAAAPSGGYFARFGKGDYQPNEDDVRDARAFLLTHSSHRCNECGRHTFEGLTRFAGFDTKPDAEREADRIAKLRERGICSSCQFWHEKIDVRDDPNVVRVNGEHYWIEPDESKPGWCSGFGGAKFVIVFRDGRRVVSRNLWGNGRIPKRFRERLPDNATFERKS